LGRGAATGLTKYLDQQLEAIRAAAIRLNEQQARTSPCRSTLSVAGGSVVSRPSRLRYFLVHQIEELTRHADIIREQIDGVAVPAIVLSEAGMEASEFFAPYRAAPGTLGAQG
jgi:hypothetical protein